jgi:molybdopterin-containing oxidoreductase family iron-sulfur binding subunit
LAETPEFRQWVEREFPEGASEWTDPVSRRNFVKIMSASFLLAGVGLAGSGCRRPVERIMPFSKMPEDYVHGIPQYFATAMPGPGSAIPLVAKSNDGRPTKIEGNSLYPDSNGGTDRFAQASILNLYDPDRAMRFSRNGGVTTREAAFDFLTEVSKNAKANDGQGLCFLLGRDSSPSRRRLQTRITNQFPKARWYAYDPVDLDIHRRAASLAFGQSVKPYLRFDQAKVIVSLDCDFLGGEADVQNHIRGFAQGRQIAKPTDSLNRLYIAESLMTITGMNADHRLRLATSAVIQLAAALAGEILKQGGLGDLENIGKPAGVDPKWITECAKDLLANKGQSLVVAGYRQPMAVHLLAHALNAALGNIGNTMVLLEVLEAKEGDIAELAKALNANEVQTLVILGGNPAYDAPADLDWAKTQRKAKTVVRLGYYEDETSLASDWNLPAAHYLESWGDARTADGTLVPIQPLIAPLFGGVTELEVLARIAGSDMTDPYSIVRETFAATLLGGDFEATWKKFLHDGYLANSAAKPAAVTLDEATVARAIGAARVSTPGKDKLEVVFHRDYSLDDGRYNNNGWLQEMPDPVTKLVWDNAVLISRKTAVELGVKNSDLVDIRLGERSVCGPIWIQPGFADYSLSLALGYGRTKTGRVGRNTGFNVYPLRTSGAPNFVVGASLQATPKTYPLSCTQSHWSIEGRPIIREVNLDQYREHPDFAQRMKSEEPPGGAKSLYPNPLDRFQHEGLHQWGMSIDLNRCVGCSACMMACQSENNVPIVGKEQVKRGREMHWIRIDRYYAGPPDQMPFKDTFEPDADEQFQPWIDNPQVVTQPMLCQHCEAAPCENVCPVNATSHDNEGLNVMTYNRCVGTRYCSNNCPYKVRRFNFFDYNKRPLDGLYWGPLAHRPDDEWALIKMIKNPDVTVRMRGVMEKCTFCLQRIEQAKIAQKRKASGSPDVIVPDGTFTTACAQACPAGAIVFGNLNDPESRVSKLKSQERDYSVLEFLLTKPRTTYLARVRNPNPEMPDYHKSPLNFQDYVEHRGDPFLENPAEAHAHGGAEKKGAE